MLSGRAELKVMFSQNVFLYLAMVLGCKRLKTVLLELSTVRIKKNRTLACNYKPITVNWSLQK